MIFKAGKRHGTRFKDVPFNTPFSVQDSHGRDGDVLMKLYGNLGKGRVDILVNLTEGNFYALNVHSENCTCSVFTKAELILNQ